MSHELRTPLNAIIGFTGLLQQLHEEQGEPDPRALDYLGRLQGSSRQLLALVFDAIDVSKLQAGAIEARPESFALDAVVAETTDLVRAAAEAKGLELRVESTTGAEMVNDRARFAQCLMNLLSNAVKYTEAGGIQVHAAVHGDLAQVAVEDTGIGVADADQARLFQPFVRIDSALRRRTPGSGLGLYLARNLARLVLGGDITMRSRAGAGSMFTLSAQRRMEPAAAQHSLLPANGGTT
jgi:signal transduction histidine kinase